MRKKQKYEMNYSQYCQKWLNVEIPEDRTPNYYEIIGVTEAEPNLKKISQAVDSALTRLQGSEKASEAPEAFAFLAHQVLNARHVLLDPALKFQYDTELLQEKGISVWKSHRRATLKERIRQFGFIGVALLLGIVVMFMMGMSVERNPDGSIIFRAEAKVQAAPPFTTPLTGLVYRPSFASDFREDGYLVEIRGQANETTAVAQAETVSLPSAGNSEEGSGGKMPQKNEDAALETLEDEFDALIPNGMALNVAENETNKEKPVEKQPEDEWDALLPEGTELANDIQDQNPDETLTNSTNQNTRFQSPLYGRITPNGEASEKNRKGTEEQSLSISENTKEEPIESGVNSTTSQIANEESVSSEKESSAVSLTNDAGKDFSPQMILELLSKAHEKIDKNDPKAELLFSVVQGQTYLEVMNRVREDSLILEPDFLEEFTSHVLETATNLAWGKYFDDAFNLCDSLSEMGVQNAFSEETLEIIEERKTKLLKYQECYENSLKIEEILKENPDDPGANGSYAMWLWLESSSIESSLPYLIKSKQPFISRAAQFELKSQEAGNAEKDEYLLKAGDLWWEVSTKMNDKFRKNLVEKHAKGFYRKADSALLSDEQKVRLNEETPEPQK